MKGNKPYRTGSQVSVRGLCAAAVFAALIYLATGVLPRIPVGAGYVHAGDAFVYLCAAFLPPCLSAPAAALGAAIADLTTGYVAWLPATAIIKAASALLFTSAGTRVLCKRNVTACFLSLLLCVGGYYVWEYIIFGSAQAPLLSVAGNVLQSVFSGLLFAAVGALADRAGLRKRLVR